MSQGRVGRRWARRYAETGVLIYLACLASLAQGAGRAPEETPRQGFPQDVMADFADTAATQPTHPHYLTPLRPDGPFPRFTPEQLRLSGYPDHLHAHTWPDWVSLQDADGQTYGPGSICAQRQLIPRPGLKIQPGDMSYQSVQLLFHPHYRPCDMMIMLELCDLGRVQCRELLGLETEARLRVDCSYTSEDYQQRSGYGTWRTFKLMGDSCFVQAVPVLVARTLIAHAAVQMMVRWTLRKNLGDALPPWLEYGLAAYIADMGVHLNNYMWRYRQDGPILLAPAQVDAALVAAPIPGDDNDRLSFRLASYSAFLMAWELVENHGGLAPLRRFLHAMAQGASADQACRDVYQTDMAGLVARLDPLVCGEPIGDAIQMRDAIDPPSSP